MDRIKACAILKIDAGASLEEAKKAYRSLAKKYHPDVIDESSCQDTDPDMKMKDINLAFRYLSPLLRSKPSVKKRKKRSVKVERKEKGSFFLKLNKFFKKVFPGKKENKMPLNKKVRQAKPKKYSKNKPGNNISFDDVLSSLHKGSSRGKQKSRKTNLYEGYQKYMSLQQRMKLRSRHDNMSIGRVEKIEPVKPVNPVGKK